MSEFIKWFETFLEEKNLPYESWELMSENGTLNLKIGRASCRERV